MAIGKIESLAGYFILLWGWKRNVASLIAGLVSAFALPPYNGFPVLFATFAIFIWLLDGAATEPAAGVFGKGWSSFKVGWWFGFGYFLSGLWWVGTAFLVEADEFAWLMPFAVILLPALLAIFWGLAAALSRIFWGEDWSRILVFSVFLALAEYLRGTLFTGLPWNALGYAAMPIPLMMQSASLIGIFGVTLLCIPVFAALGVFTPKSALRPRGTTKMLVLALVLLLAHLGFGYWRLSQASNDMVADVSLRLVQPAIAQDEKWLPEKEAEIFQRYLTLSTKGTSAEKKGLSGTTHLIWPESAFPFLLTERKDALAAIGAMLPEGTTLITGAARVESSVAGQASGFVFNSIYTIDSEGVIASAADKVHLVPFGEYLPFQELAESLGLQQLTKIRGGFEPGNIRPLLSAMNGPAFLPLICYEIIFSGDVRPKGDDKKPEWIVNLTNDAWFGMTPGPYQHLQQAIVRGVEEGLPVVRVANSGISSVTDSYGRALGQISLGEIGVIDTSLPKPSAQTFFTRSGHLSFYVLTGILFLAGVFGRRRVD